MCFLYSEAFDCKEFFQSDRQISETLGFSDHTLRTAKSHAKKYLTSRMVGLPSRNKWTLHEDELIGALASLQSLQPSYVENDTHCPVENDTQHPVENDSSTIYKKELITKHLITKEHIKNKDILCENKKNEVGRPAKDTEGGLVGEAFDKAWQAYPLKKAKERSVLALIKILASKTPDEGKSLAKEIWCGLKAHIAEHEAKKELKEQGAEIWVPELPYLASWLNQARWHDHYQSPEEILITATRKKTFGVDLAAREQRIKQFNNSTTTRTNT